MVPSVKRSRCEHLHSLSRSKAMSSWGRGKEEEESEASDGETELLPGLPHHLALQCLAQVPLVSMWGVSHGWNRVLTSTYFQSLRTSYGAANPTWLYTMVWEWEWEWEPHHPQQDGSRGPVSPGTHMPATAASKKKSFFWLAHDPLSGTWCRLPDMPEEVDFQLSSPGLIGVSYSVQTQSTRDRLFVVAGLKAGAGDHLEPALDAPFVFDINEHSWRKGSPFLVPRKWCAGGVADGKLFVASGCGREWDESVSKSVEAYDPIHDTWTTVGEMSTSKMSAEAMNAVNVGGKLYMSSGNGIFLKAGLVFDPATRSWSTMGRALKQGWRPSTVAVNQRFFSLDEVAGRLDVFRAEDDCWTTFLEDPRLQNMKNLTGCMGKLCGSVTGDGVGSVLRIVDLSASPPSFLDVPVPRGEVVALQVADALPFA